MVRVDACRQSVDDAPIARGICFRTSCLNLRRRIAEFHAMKKAKTHRWAAADQQLHISRCLLLKHSDPCGW
eukprot:5850155-Pleurochrysis_carterae.AAC.2